MALRKIVQKIFGTQNERELKSLYPIVHQINGLESSIKLLSNADLQAKTQHFKERLSQGELLDRILPEAFAVVREAAFRVIGQRHYDVQLLGGITLHRGRIAEMRTGEGKTLVATLPCYLNALTGKGVHVITVNDYLAKRDAEWMGRIYQFLGLSTGIITHGLRDFQRKENYARDITYGTNNEFGFDYLRDNMKFKLEDYVQRELHYAIVDEVDSILIDEARTPLIISGPTENSSDLYYKINSTLTTGGKLEPEVDYTVDEKSRTASLTDSGVDKIEKRLGVANLYDPSHIELLHHVNQGLRAQVLYKKDVDYVVKNDEVIIVDEFTGRLMAGRRWSDGLHQAIEAKENVTIENENQTLATITFQNYFRMYEKLSGMTGTADTEALEFKQIYKLDVTVVPPNRSMIRKDHSDVIFKSETSKLKAIVEEIKSLQQKGQPVLVGTVSVEKSENISAILSREKIAHSVLNAKQHEREADIVAQAGRKGTITISTNMAGRGTDILLGGNPEALAKSEIAKLRASFEQEKNQTQKKKPLALITEVQKEEWEQKEAELLEQEKDIIAKWNAQCVVEREEVKAAGGLFILGTERHESRRIDNQLRGRAGRQGDPGESRFYLSLDDDLMRIFGGSKVAKFMEDDVPIEHHWISKAIENAQKKVEGHNYDIRKHLLEYDDVMNQQRKVVYSWRKEVLQLTDLEPMILSMAADVCQSLVTEYFPGNRWRAGAHVEEGLQELANSIKTILQIQTDLKHEDIRPFTAQGLTLFLHQLVQKTYQDKKNSIGPEKFSQIEKMILLGTIDQLWKDHLLAMDHLREGIGLQGYGQKDPLIEYKKQGFKFFEMMMGQITHSVIEKLFSIQTEPQELMQWDEHTDPQNLQYNVDEDGSLDLPEDLKKIISPQNPVLKEHKNAQMLRREGHGQQLEKELVEFMMQHENDPKFLEKLEKKVKDQPEFMKLIREIGAFLPEGDRPSRPEPQAPLPIKPAKKILKPTNPLPPSTKIPQDGLCPCGSGRKYKKCHGL